MNSIKTLSLIFSIVASANAQLEVSVAPLKVVGQKIIVPLAMKNSFDQKIESARAAVFIMDTDGKMIGQGTKWVIGGNKTNGLASGATNVFNFVITADKPVATTNLTAKVTFNRALLEGGKPIDVKKDVHLNTR